jgi:dynactin-2
MLEMTEIEKRVARLETLVGDGDVADLYPDLCSALDALEARVALVDPATLKAVGKQITELEARLVAAEGVPEGQGGGGDTNASASGFSSSPSRLSKLVHVVERWDAVAMTLPMLIERMRTLRSVHEDATAVVHSVRELQQVHAQTAAALKAQESALALASQSLGDNVATMAANLSCLDARLQALES